MSTSLFKSRVLLLTAFLTATWTMADMAELPATADTTLYDNPVPLANSAGSYLFAGMKGMDGGFELTRTLLSFDVASALPAGATVTSAVMRITVDRKPPSASTDPFALHLALTEWNEGTSDAGGNEAGGAPATAGDATWDHSEFSTSLWTTEGGDFVGAASAVTAIGDTGAYFFQSSQMTLDVQGWLDAPSSEFGWFLLGDETSPQSVRRFNARNDPDVAPTLFIGYTPIPEPASALLIGAGMLVLFRFRRMGFWGRSLSQ